MVLDDRSSEQKVHFFFSCSTAERWKKRNKFTIARGESIILCAPLATNLVVEQKWPMLQVERENRVSKFVKLRMLQRDLYVT